eukprot:469249-Rhodomonas_salina.3
MSVPATAYVSTSDRVCQYQRPRMSVPAVAYRAHSNIANLAPRGLLCLFVLLVEAGRTSVSILDLAQEMRRTIWRRR